jgi:O-antigen/teichoic acid export membrane protein
MTVLITSAGTLLTSIDRTVILEKLSEEQLGFYGIAFIVITFLTGVAGVPNAVLYPRLSERFGETGRAADLAPMVLEPIRTLGIGFAALTGTGCLLLPPLVRLFLPKFIPGIFAAQIAMFATYPYVVVGVASSALLALNTQRTYLGIVLFASGVSYAAARGLVHFWPGLPAVAAGCGVGLFTYMVGVVGGALWVMEQPATAAVRAIASAMWPVLLIGAIALGASAGLSRLLPGHPWLAAISGAAIVLAVSAPLVLRSARQLLRG